MAQSTIVIILNKYNINALCLDLTAMPEFIETDFAA